MKCQKLSCWLFTAVALKVIYIVEVVFVCFFWGEGQTGIWKCFSHFFLFLALRKKKQPSAAVTRKTEAT